jgi:leucyl/phenylalanyl-tRNA--protein transferase
MALHILTDQLWFPPVADAMEDGLLAIGGDVSLERLLLAYKRGIFPWYEGDMPMWWSPNPRFVLYPDKLKISKSMQGVIKKNTFQFTINQNFAAVLHNCKTSDRKGQDGTWITHSLEKSLNEHHALGFAHSAETWREGELVGGLYGIRIGHIFFGESMFSLVPNASKFAFIQYVTQLKLEGVTLIDCQIYTQHLESMGAEMISREKFINSL